MDFSSLNFLRLTPEYQIKPFDCGDKDLNEFLFNDAKNYLNELLAVTYLIEDNVNDKTIAFYSLSNDKVSYEETFKRNNKLFRKFRKRFHSTKQKLMSFPAMKVGRLGVGVQYQKQGYGKAILDYLKILFISENRTGCRVITVDAYIKSILFYQDNHFEYLLPEEGEEQDAAETRLMYYDLTIIANSSI